jgi:hypothetical protein
MAALEQLRYAVKVRSINDELLEHLASTLWWLLHYAAKNNIDLPGKNKISLALDRAIGIAANNHVQELAPIYQHPNETPLKTTELML